MHHQCLSTRKQLIGSRLLPIFKLSGFHPLNREWRVWIHPGSYVWGICLTHKDIKIPKSGRKIYSFNKGNYDLWDEKLRKYLDHLRQPGSNGKPYSGRYIGCLVGEIHRMLLYGGIYGNPDNKNAKNGNLRLLYECAPMSYLIEQAGGKAIDGHHRILDIKPEQVHQRTTIFIGSSDEIEVLEKYLA